MPNVRKDFCLEISNWLCSKASQAQHDYEVNKLEMKRLANEQSILKQKAKEAHRMAYEFKKQAGIKEE